MSLAIAIDLGATKVATALVNSKGHLLDLVEIPTEADRLSRPQDLIDKLLVGVLAVLKSHHAKPQMIRGLGLAACGPLDVQKGLLVRPANFKKLKQVAVINLLEKSLKQRGFPFRVFLQNDAMASALGELWMIKQTQISTLVSITVGTGIGTGCVVNRSPLQTRGLGSEWGHEVIDFETRRSVEDVCAGPALLQRACQASGIKFVDWKSAEDYFLSKPQSRKVIEQIFLPTAQGLAILCRNLSLGLAPQKIIFSGGVLNSYGYFFKTLQREYHFLMKKFPQFESKLLISRHYNSNLLGAASLVFKNSHFAD